MSFSAILLALLLEQARPMAPGNPFHAGVRAWVRSAVKYFDAGHAAPAALAWCFAAALPGFAALAIHWLLMSSLGWIAAAVWNVAVLYLALGFRQFSHHFTTIRDALEAGDEPRARELLARWQQMDAGELPRTEILRQVIEHSVLAAHRHVFGVLTWYSVLAALGMGPLGAVIYRLGEFVPRYWHYRSTRHLQPASPQLQNFAVHAWQVMDWLPSRITALGFAVVGSFEDAVDAWRNYSQRPDATNDGIILAATSGAMGIQLGAKAPAGTVAAPGDEADSGAARAAASELPGLAHLPGIVRLVWRSVVMWMLLLALVGLARAVG
jgi:adenosylcobinamide-phosphate synthase